MNGRRRAPTIQIAAAATVIFLVLALPSAAQAGGTTARAAGKGPILIGQIVPLTGVQTLRPGRHELAGARLAVRKINAHGGVRGRKLKLIVVDDRSTSEGGIEALARLARKHVKAIIGPGHSGEIVAMTPSIERAGIPMIIGGTFPITTHLGNPWVFRTRPNDIYSNRALATFAVKTLHLARIALIYAGAGGGTELHDDLKALGATPVTEQMYSAFASDLAPQVLAIKKSGATGLISLGSQPADFVLLAQQVRQVGVHVTWLGNPILAAAALEPGGAIFHGDYSVTDYAAAQSPEAAAFERLIEATMHEPANFAEAYTYDGVQILARVMRKVGTNARAIRRGILAIRGYRGVEGTYTFDRNGDGLRQYTVVKDLHGRLQVIKVLSF